MKVVNPNTTPCLCCGQNMTAISASQFDNMVHVTYRCDCGCSYGRFFYINENGEYTVHDE